MRKMKLMTLAGALLCACLAFGQDATPATPAPHRKFDLGLTQQQKTQLHSIHTSAMDQAAIIRHDATLSQQQKQQQIQQLRQSTRTQIKAVFTPEQQQKLAQMREARQAKLGLTQEQRSQLKTLFSGARQQRQSVLNNASLSNQQKLTQLQQIRQSTHTQLASILTPDQLQMMRHMRRGHRWGMGA